MSDAARSFIEARGGRLYVWFSPLGRSPFSAQRASCRAPNGVEFDQHRVGSVDVFLQADFEPPEELTVRRRPWPIGPIEVIGTGAGQAWGGGSEGGAGWPTHHGGDGGGGGGGHHG